MATKITTISLQTEDLELISKFNLSPTALIKERLAEYRKVSGLSAEFMVEQTKKIERLSKTIQEYADFLNKEQLMDKFLKI
jgi:hypothetical protein